MDCTLATLIACFHLSGLYLDTGFWYQDVGMPVTYKSDFPVMVDGVQIANIPFERVDYPLENPYASLALGYEINFRNLTIAIEAQHRSSLAVSYDNGVNSIGLRARWRPFR